MAFSDGDFVKIDYSAWRAADSKLIYTTSRKMAEENGMLDPDGTYAPQLIVLGKKNAIKGVEDALRGMSVGETKKVDIEPKDAFGERDPGLIKVMPIADFKRRDIDPYPGMQLDVDGAAATVKSVNSGRVTVDMNHPFAGEKLLYEIKVLEKVDRDEDRVGAIAAMYSLAPDSVAISGDTVRVLFGEKTKKNSRYMLSKNDFVNVLLSYMGNVSRVSVQEDYARTKEKEADEAEEGEASR